LPGSQIAEEEGLPMARAPSLGSRHLDTPLALSVQRSTAKATLYTGALTGALYAVAMPQHFDGKVLVLAHGFRDPKIPLVADLDPSEPFIHRLVKAGWVVAMTSYRRRGGCGGLLQPGGLRAR